MIAFPEAAAFNQSPSRRALMESITLDVLYQNPLPPVVQAPNKGGKGGKPGRGSRTKGRKRKKQNKKKKRERPLADYQ